MSEPNPRTCPHCDFGTGRRGMDRCSRCDGTGSVFRVGLKLYPNTEEGFKAAEEAIASIPPVRGNHER